MVSLCSPGIYFVDRPGWPWTLRLKAYTTSVQLKIGNSYFENKETNKQNLQKHSKQKHIVQQKLLTIKIYKEPSGQGHWLSQWQNVCPVHTYKSPHFIANISKTLFDSKPKSKEETIQLRAGKKHLTKYFTKKRHTDKQYDRCYQVWWHTTVIPGSQTACTKKKERKGGGAHHSGEKAQQLRMY